MSVRILVGDVRERLADIETGSVQCVVTSPPYFGLRDYGTAEWEGGDPGCDHDIRRWEGAKQTQGAQSGHASAADKLTRRSCPCGATRIDAQIGLEPTLAEYIASLVDVFREVRRVLRDDGTLWLNLGDSYAASGGTGTQGATGQRATRTFTADGTLKRTTPGLKPKDLMMVPARVAIALQEDGWYLRSDIIWAKPNPMPESVTDRPTSAHEHVFLLSKSPRYYYDADAIREQGPGSHPLGANRSSIPGRNDNDRYLLETNPLGRNKRNVWTISTTPYPGAHFATFPPKLVEPMILAGTSEKGCCPACGAPWKRILEKHATGRVRQRSTGGLGTEIRRESHGLAPVDGIFQEGVVYETVGWSPSCACAPHTPEPCVVLDPFLGSGTTLLVADRLGRNGVGIELNPEYAAMAERRIRSDAPMLAAVEVA